MKNNTKKANCIADKELDELLKPLPTLEKNLVVDHDMRNWVNNLLQYMSRQKSGSAK